MPPGETCVPCVATVESAHWGEDKGVPAAITKDILAAKMAAVHPWHHLAPPVKIAGQIGDGRYPQQTDDLKMAIAALRRDPRCDGRVEAVGGSGGGNLVAWLQAQGLVDAAVAFSPATYLPDLLVAGGYPAEKAINYAPSTPSQIAASPLTYLQAGVSTPVMLVAFQTDAMPMNQYTDYDAGLVKAGIEHESIPLPGNGHSWPAATKVAWIAFLKAHLPPLGSPTPTATPSATPTPSGSPTPTTTPIATVVVPRGLSALIAGGKPVDAGVRSSPSVNMLSLRVPWWKVEPTADAYDFSYFKTEIAAALAVNPAMQFSLLVQTGDGSQSLGGFKPDWLFPLVGISANSHIILPGVTYSFTDNGKIVTIPVFWNEILKARKHALIVAWGKWRDGLPKAQHDAIKMVRVSWVNGNGDDWFIPDDDSGPESADYKLSQAQRWLQEAGYTTQKMIDTAVDLFAAACAAFPDLPVGHSIAQNGPVIDKAAATAAGDTNTENYLARAVNKALQAAHPGRIITQKNGIAAVTTPADRPPKSTGGYGLFLEIAQSGAPVAGQALWRVSGDTGLRMNSGTRDDHDYTGAPPIPQLTDDQILERSGTKLVGYKAYFYEVYSADVLALPKAAATISAQLR